MPIAHFYSQARDQVEQLVERFARNLAAYKRPDYRETQLRVEFIDPLFEALGWDVRNVQGYAEPYKDVVHEDALKVGGATRAPDYCFRIGGTRKFFLEAKKPSVAVSADVGPAYQLRRYAWSAKLPLSLLTDFEELAVYDCRQRPMPADKASAGRILYLTYDTYPARFDELWGAFAYESVVKGSFDRFVESSSGKRGTGEVDHEFLREIEGWREVLARSIALRNPGLSVHELNFAVQHTIDRILFLRMCEDRGIEPYGALLALTAGPHIYPRLVDDLYRRADDRYNSGLFDFRADTLTGRLAIDDKVLKPILAGLYYPDCPYEFSVLPVEVLGQVYEQFLGKVIRLTAGHRAVVEEKPEVKKAGGVYYTPAYIVDYIVRQTVGQLVEGKSPRELRAFAGDGVATGSGSGAGVAVRAQHAAPRPATGPAPLRVLDMACGSGSFLLGAYQYLLDHCRRWYETNDPAKHAGGKQPAVYQAAGGDWRLTTAEKKRILLDHIYGVDVDRQAVEVTKLSLLLKVLEGETDETVRRQLAFWHERALPDLGKNIQCGNSLIGPEFFDGRLLPDEEEVRRVNPFGWERAFPEVFPRPDKFGETGQVGGFDVIIGNPPYIRIQTLQEWAPGEAEFYKLRYRAAGKGNYDIYVVFVERGLQLLSAPGRLGFILPHKFFQAKYGEPLRELVAAGQHLAEVVHFGDQQVFAGATTYTCLMFLDKAGKPGFRFVEAHDLAAWRAGGQAVQGEIGAEQVTAKEWNFLVGRGTALFDKLRGMPVRLKDLASLFVGLQTDADDVYILEEVGRDGPLVYCKTQISGQVYPFENEHLRRLAKGSLNVRRYYFSDLSKRLVFPYEMREGRSVLLTSREYQQRFPLTWSYLNVNKSRLTGRGQGRLPAVEWYGYVYRKNHTRFSLPKLLVPSIATGSCFAPDLGGELYFVGSGGGGGGGYGITLLPDAKVSYMYLLGLLNSKVVSHFLRQGSTTYRGGYIALNRQYIERTPIRTIDFSSPVDVARHDHLVALVERMLDLHTKLPAASIPAEKELFRRQIEATDRQIDALVYELYGLSDQEICMVEGQAAG